MGVPPKHEYPPEADYRDRLASPRASWHRPWATRPSAPDISRASSVPTDSSGPRPKHGRRILTRHFLVLPGPRSGHSRRPRLDRHQSFIFTITSNPALDEWLSLFEYASRQQCLGSAGQRQLRDGHHNRDSGLFSEDAAHALPKLALLRQVSGHRCSDDLILQLGLDEIHSLVADPVACHFGYCDGHPLRLGMTVHLVRQE